MEVSLGSSVARWVTKKGSAFLNVLHSAEAVYRLAQKGEKTLGLLQYQPATTSARGPFVSLSASFSLSFALFGLSLSLDIVRV